MSKGRRISIWIGMVALLLKLSGTKNVGKERKMTTFDQVIKQVFHHEGGYVNDPDDPGGETKYGISKRAFPDEDIKELTKKRAAKLYYDHYWIPSKVNLLPDSIRAIYFDMAVNMGIKRAATILQKACNHKNKVKIKVDGRLGKNTAKHSKILEPERLRSFRVKYYADLVSRKPTLEKYWFGWYRRALAV
tara:strand:+ start:89 stop:658 length:570 start_codon:yes stop_codon:yes gene_type:complete